MTESQVTPTSTPVPTWMIVLMDRSGSMDAIWDDTVGGFNTLVKEQQKVPGEAKLMLGSFDDKYEEIFPLQPLADVPELKEQIFPRNSTALFDAIARVIFAVSEKLMEIPDNKDWPVPHLTIFTDGRENSSKEYGGPAGLSKIRSIIELKRSQGWVIEFRSCDEEAIQTGTSLGLPRGVIFVFPRTGEGMASSMGQTSRSFTQTRTGGRSSSSGSGGKKPN